MSKPRLDCTNSKRDCKTCKQPETPCRHCPPKPDLSRNPCNCEVTARALSDDVPKFLGLKNLRAALQKESETGLNLKDPNESIDSKEPKDPKDPKEPKEPKYCKDPKTQTESSENSKPVKESENKDEKKAA